MVTQTTQFECPQCGSHSWGSESFGPPPTLGTCHGYVTRPGKEDLETHPCGYKWNRDSDFLCFVVVLKANTKQEFKKMTTKAWML